MCFASVRGSSHNPGMSLPMFGGPPAGPPPTHTPIPPERILPIAQELMGKGRGPLTTSDLESVAESAGVPVSHAYVAAGMLPFARFEQEHEVTFVVCSGGCQRYGSLELLERLLETREQRIEAGEPAFDVQTRGCLDACSHAPAVQVRTKEGVGTIPKATFENLEEALELVAGT